MVPAIRNMLGGFLFAGDDVYKKAGVLSGGERTRLAVARMLLRPSNTLLLDEPTNHLDLDSKDVLLDALEDYGGTLILVSHDRYFVERLATKIIEIGHGEAQVYPGHLHRVPLEQEEPGGRAGPGRASPTEDQLEGRAGPAARAWARRARAEGDRAAQGAGDAGQERDERKRHDAERKKKQRTAEALQRRIAELETRIAASESQVKELEATMATAGFFEDPVASSRSSSVIRR